MKVMTNQKIFCQLSEYLYLLATVSPSQMDLKSVRHTVGEK